MYVVLKLKQENIVHTYIFQAHNEMKIKVHKHKNFNVDIIIM